MPRFEWPGQIGTGGRITPVCARHTVVTIDGIEAGLRVVATRVEENPAYLPLFERLIEERAAMIRKRESLELVKQWAS